MTRRQTRFFFVAGTTIFAARLHRADHPQPHAIRRADARGRDHARGDRGQARVAPQELHQLPHAARRGRLLRAGSDEDRAASGRRLPAAVPPGSVPVLFRGAPRTADAQPAALGTADHPGHRLPHLGFAHRQPELAAASDPRHGRLSAGHRARHRRRPRRHRPTRWRSARRSSGGRLPPVSAVTRSRRTSSSSGRRWPAWRRAPPPSCRAPTTRARLARRRTTSANRS